MTIRTVRIAAVSIAMVVGGAVATTSFASDARTAAAPAAARQATLGKIAIVQAVPQLALTVTVDGDQVEQAVAEGTIVGPLELAAGDHDITFSGGGGDDISSTVTVTAGESSDVVVHRPAAVGGTPVVSVYPTPSDPIDPGKARVLLAHTATTAPADVVVDGQTVFTNIANGEFAQADVAAGAHEVSLLPAGVTGKPILGPLDVTLKAGTVTAVYAVGNPKDGSMNVIVRTTGGTRSGSEAPTQIDTGSAGLVDGVHVWTFTSR
jgi:hypothetical protein